jgi:hypothetical protein
MGRVIVNMPSVISYLENFGVLGRLGAAEYLSRQDNVSKVPGPGPGPAATPPLSKAGGRSRFASIVEVSFAGKNLSSQVSLMQSTDVLISTHGAGETNAAFMLPCSIVIEICPFGLGSENSETTFTSEYFQGLAKSVDLVHRGWVEAKEKCVLGPTVKNSAGHVCRKIYDPLSPEPDLALNQCSNNVYCRACVRLADIRLNLSRLGIALESALAARERCIEKHFLFN